MKTFTLQVRMRLCLCLMQVEIELPFEFDILRCGISLKRDGPLLRSKDKRGMQKGKRKKGRNNILREEE